MTILGVEGVAYEEGSSSGICQSLLEVSRTHHTLELGVLAIITSIVRDG